MFLDWPEQKRELQEELVRTVQRRVLAGAPVVAQVPRVVVKEGAGLHFVYPDGTRTVMALKPHEFSVGFQADELRGGGSAPLVRAATELSSSMASGMERELIQTMRQASDKNAAIFGGKSVEDVGAELIKALEALDFGFDEDGKPSIVLILLPEIAAQLPRLAEDTELERQAQAIIERKRREWLHRESHRRLVD